MILNRRHLLNVSLATAATVAAPRIARAETYPARPVRLIAPFAAGGPNDLMARLIAQGLSNSLGKQFYVENIGGAGGNVGTGQASRAAPDGYTMIAVAPSYATNPALFDSVPYDPNRSFDAVTVAATAPTILTVHPSVPAKTVGELIAAIKATPGKYSYASPGAGTPPHLLGELFRLSLQLDMVHVPFSSGGQAIGSTLAGHTPISFGALPPAVEHVKDGKLRALAITSTEASDALSGVPTVAQAGYPDFAADIWTAVLVPAGTPRDIVALLQREIAALVNLPETRDRMAALGYRPVGSTPDDCAKLLAMEANRWAKVIKDAGIKAR
ncbi:tripartite tricarboxylate transporter family receptor [Variibacter gotjawalensis]|uniref:Tripartite tricarboxylate transporter family receptor n=1 Tax=Variibacter gotjawalensis TaxID=1333996 RepID=A0A0S3Q044_9BRAD|nr:tripartite tricarboxylate transporter substrate-binding protein [Variibacter gotjawalensis]NIK47384.1 tripartite-type tricarboxylate transporter receptor subunit TctC [Variibacter gotjawalensis]RZS49280.1 tripartite-type tricarboxylate transporter receptor subunit TctC [Variibacter gotjawalensis]BAT61544.1 tripartite tricarboxylate transporter family receptor [Variibacter gotjawalensis]